MPAVLSLWKRITAHSEPQARGSSAPAEPDRFLLLIPRGGLSFSLMTFPEFASMQSYASGNLVDPLYEGIIALEVLGYWVPRTSDPVAAGNAEVVVMIDDPMRPGIVQLYTFVDMAGAQAFVGDAAAAGLNPGQVRLDWARQVPISSELDPAPMQASVPASSTVEAARTRSSPQPPATGRPATHAPGGKPGAPEAAAETTSSAEGDRFPSLSSQMLSAALLEGRLFQELPDDARALRRAAWIVALSALALGVASVAGGPASMMWHVIGGLVGWAGFAAVMYIAGLYLFGERQASAARFFEIAGLASSPAVLFVLGAVPVYGPLLVLVVFVWVGIATAVAIRAALELDLEPAIIVVGVGWVVYFAGSLALPAALGS